jgi:hypothetical protein
MLLFEGRKPRLASVLVGGVIFCVVQIVGFLLEWAQSGFDPRLLFPGLLWGTLLLPLGFPFGGMVGYLAGCLLAGVFFVLKRLDEAQSHRRKAGEHGDATAQQADVPSAAKRVRGPRITQLDSDH